MVSCAEPLLNFAIASYQREAKTHFLQRKASGAVLGSSPSWENDATAASVLIPPEIFSKLRVWKRGHQILLGVLQHCFNHDLKSN